MRENFKKIIVSRHPAFITIRLNNGRGNVIDRDVMLEMSLAVKNAASDPAVKALLFCAEGDHFSFGASVPEHQADQVAGMLAAFHDLFRTLIDSSLPTLSAVRGQCLGGGFELVAFTHWIFASQGAKFGQPEVNLAVFPPVASLVLPFRIGQTLADDLNLTGRSASADEMHKAGLVHEVTDRPENAAVEFIESNLAPKSGAALRHTVRSSRFTFHSTFLQNISLLERDYLEGLMKTNDANEGIKAFMEKRKPVWTNT